MKIKIAHVQVLPKMTGVQQISFDILNGLDESLYERYIIFGSSSDGVGGQVDSTEIERTFTDIGVNVIFLPNLRRKIGYKDISAFLDLYEIFVKYKFDIVHTNSTKPAILGRIAARLAGIKCILHTVHGISFHRHTNFFSRIFYYIFEMLSLMFGHVNISVNNYYLKYYPDFLTKNITIPNGVDFSNFTPNKVESNIIRIAFFARLDVQKNPMFYLKLIKKFSEMCSLNEKVKFYLAGDGILKEDCLNYIEEELNGIVDYVGWIEDKNLFLNNIDIIIHPSNWEAFGLSIIEAAYFGIPCIGSNVEGIPEVIIDGKTGYICDLKKPEVFLQCLLSLITDHDLRADISNHTRVNAIKNFRSSKMLNLYDKLYKSQVKKSEK